MSGRDAVAMLRGQVAERCLAAMSWAPADALRALVRGVDADDPARALAGVATELDLDLVFVPAQAAWAADAVDALASRGIASAWAVPGPFGRVAQLRGWAETLKASAAEPGALASQLAEALHDALVDLRSGVGLGADVLVVADDLAASHGWLVSPDFALDAVVPCFHRLAAEADAAGLPSVLHSDGDVRAIFTALHDGGFSAVHPGGLDDAAIREMLSAARNAGLVVLGGLTARALIGEGARGPGRRAGELARDGSLIICDDGGMSRPEELAAYAVAVQTARETCLRTEEGGR